MPKVKEISEIMRKKLIVIYSGKGSQAQDNNSKQRSKSNECSKKAKVKFWSSLVKVMT